MNNLIHRFFSKVRDSLAATVHYRLYSDERMQYLQHLALLSEASGVRSRKTDETEVIVSLTTHGRRLYEVYLAIESIFQGSVKPNRVILWLSAESKEKTLPLTLQNQAKRGLEIRYTDDIGPYTKIVPTLKAFPEAIVVTIDDDILYPFDALEMLLTAHRSNPSAICANRVMDLKLNSSGHPTSLPTWKELKGSTRISKQNFFEGVGSVLYPPHCFDSEVLNESLFLRLCPTADDVWLNVSALRLNIPIVPANCHYDGFPLLINESVQDSALWRTNNASGKTRNDIQLKAVLEHFHCTYAQ